MRLWDKIKKALEPRSHSLPNPFLNPDWPPYPEHITKGGVRITNQYETQHWQVKMRQVLAKTVPHFGFGNCKSCGLPWWVVLGHTVMYSPSGGCFAICESCWKDLGADEALPFYIAVLEEWNTGPHAIGDEALAKAEEYLRQQIFGDGFRCTLIPPDDKWWEKEE